jgi:hypothetical protein
MKYRVSDQPFTTAQTPLQLIPTAIKMTKRRSGEGAISVSSHDLHEKRSWLNRRVMALINMLGAPQVALHRPWVKRLAVVNGLLHAYVTIVLFRDR